MLSVAQIGVGYWGPGLLRNLVSSKRCSVKTVVDLVEERRDYVKRLYPGIQTTDVTDAVFQDPDIGAVVIATPVATHFDLAITALKAGKHILVEKPLATSVAEVEEIAALARAKHLVAMVGHTFLFSPPVRYVRKLIDSGEVGDVCYIYSQRLNLGRIRSDVDALWNFAPHDISIVQYWLNEPTPLSVVRRGADYLQDAIDDVVFLNILYPNKVMANIHVSWLDPRRIRMMILVGTKKMVVYDDTAENKVALYDKGIDRKAAAGQAMNPTGQGAPQFSYRSGDVILPQIDSQEPLRLEIDHFVDCILNGVDCLTGPEHARKVVQILSSTQRE
jgi:predicted dehydrogenase